MRPTGWPSCRASPSPTRTDACSAEPQRLAARWSSTVEAVVEPHPQIGPGRPEGTLAAVRMGGTPAGASRPGAAGGSPCRASRPARPPAGRPDRPGRPRRTNGPSTSTRCASSAGSRPSRCAVSSRAATSWCRSGSWSTGRFPAAQSAGRSAGRVGVCGTPPWTRSTARRGAATCSGCSAGQPPVTCWRYEGPCVVGSGGRRQARPAGARSRQRGSGGSGPFVTHSARTRRTSPVRGLGPNDVDLRGIRSPRAARARTTSTGTGRISTATPRARRAARTAVSAEWR